MSIQPPYDLLQSLRRLRAKIESDPEPRTPSLQHLYRLTTRRIAEIEAAHRSTSQRSSHGR